MSTATTKTFDDLARENAALHDELEKAKAQLEALVKETRSKNAELERLKHKLEALLHRLYGRRSEKGHPGQLSLFAPEEPEEVILPVENVPDDESALEADKPNERKRRRKPRALKNRDLPRVRELLDVPEHEKTCRCCGAQKVVMGETSRDEYDYEPASVFIREIVRPKYVCSACDEITIAELPPALIERGMPGPGLLAQVVTAKYADHLPLYRQEAIFARHGFELSRQTMCDWIGIVAHHLLAIVLAMRRELLKRAVIQADETYVMMQTNAASKGCVRAYLWLTTSPESDIVLYEFHVTRSQSVVEALLDEFEGEVLLADGYAGYNPSEKHGVKRAGCWAHARRKAREGMASHPAEASEMFVLIQMLYAIEKRARDLGLDADGRLELRQKESRKVLADIRARVDALKAIVLPKSALGEALHYLDSQWQCLIAFADDGRIPIDNNNSERGMKPVAVGRKNWLFAGSVQGGKNAAILYSIIETCKRIGVPPFEYLRDVLSRISTHPHRLIHELTPAGWKAARDAAKAATGPT